MQPKGPFVGPSPTIVRVLEEREPKRHGVRDAGVAAAQCPRAPLHIGHPLLAMAPGGSVCAAGAVSQLAVAVPC